MGLAPGPAPGWAPGRASGRAPGPPRLPGSHPPAARRAAPAGGAAAAPPPGPGGAGQAPPAAALRWHRRQRGWRGFPAPSPSAPATGCTGERPRHARPRRLGTRVPPPGGRGSPGPPGSPRRCFAVGSGLGEGHKSLAELRAGRVSIAQDTAPEPGTRRRGPGSAGVRVRSRALPGSPCFSPFCAACSSQSWF